MTVLTCAVLRVRHWLPGLGLGLDGWRLGLDCNSGWKAHRHKRQHTSVIPGHFSPCKVVGISNQPLYLPHAPALW